MHFIVPCTARDDIFNGQQSARAGSGSTYSYNIIYTFRFILRAT